MSAFNKQFAGSGTKGIGDLHPSLHANASPTANYSQLLRAPQHQQAPSGGYSRPLGEGVVSSDALQNLSEFSASSLHTVDKLASQVDSLRRAVDQTRAAYNGVLSERDTLHERLVEANSRLSEVQRVVSRYAVVEDPVVASDGYTYERKVIEKYLDECAASKTDAISQQTKEVLTDTLLPNQSLRKLVDLLKTVKAQDMPPISDHRGSRPHQDSELNRFGVTEDDDEDGHRNRPGWKQHQAPKEMLRASDLEATWAATAGGPKDGKGSPKLTSVNSRDGGSKDRSGRLHPCIRVYGFCNYKDECAFALFPYEACLNNIKGKCRFGTSCKELHVDPQATQFVNGKAAQSLAQATGQARRGGGTAGGSAPNTPVDSGDKGRRSAGNSRK